MKKQVISMLVLALAVQLLGREANAQTVDATVDAKVETQVQVIASAPGIEMESSSAARQELKTEAHAERPERGDQSVEIKAAIEQFQRSRVEFVADTTALAREMKEASEEQRARLRASLRAARAELQEARQELLDQIGAVAGHLREHSRKIKEETSASVSASFKGRAELD